MNWAKESRNTHLIHLSCDGSKHLSHCKGNLFHFYGALANIWRNVTVQLVF